MAAIKESDDFGRREGAKRLGRVSLIVPTFNRVALLRETLRCFEKQSYSDIEVLVCDDGSTDSTGAMVQREFPNARYLRLPRGGAPAARNAGMRMASGEFLKFIDSDDLLEPETIAAQVQALEETKADVCCCPCRTLGTTRGLPELSLPAPPPSHSRDADEWLRLWLRGGGTGIHAFLFRRRVLESVGFWDEALVLRQDTDYVYRTLLGGAGMVSIPRGCAVYRRHADSVISAEVLRPSGLDSWLSVIDKVRTTLERQGRVDKFRRDLSFAYFLIARRAFGVDRDLSLRAYRFSCLLVPGGVPQGGGLYCAMYKLFGFHGAQRLEALKAWLRGYKPKPFGESSR